jgi:CheY-like chemotaxis protein/two-component sensor histidine kinase
LLINDILDFNKIEAGKVDFERIDFDLKEVARNIKLSFDPAANAKGVTLNLQVEEGIPDLLIGDPTRISQIIINLVGNALKFTEKGEINIILSKRLRPGNQLEVTFRIRDTGIGISPKKLETIFETFSQGSSNTTRRYGGTGLGLSITKKLLELMGSRIQVQSRLGVGSEFSFRLNLDISQSIKETKVVAANNNLLPSLKGYKILLVEDNLINIKIADQILKKWDIEVFVAKNGREAVNMFSPGKYSLILMDLHMPEMDGYEATVEIRKLDKNIPIIALTAAALVEDKQKVFAAGMNDFISKPFKPNDLYNKITKSILEASLNV